jgi:hypothetical protein
MTKATFQYPESSWPVRTDLTSAHARAWRHIAAPGTWLSGRERVAVANETRVAPACAHCDVIAAALSPVQVAGQHTRASDLPQLWVEVIHRIRNDAARLSDSWYESVLERGMTAQQYVEIVGVLAHIVAIDSFTDALGLERHKLPEPLAGEPARVLPAGAKLGLARVPTVAPEDVGPGEADLYANLSGANIHRALSLVPAEVWGFFDLDTVMYLPDSQLRDFEHEFRAIDHAQIELVAARVSALNSCFY